MQDKTKLKNGCIAVFTIIILIFVAKTMSLVARYSLKRNSCNKTMKADNEIPQGYHSNPDKLQMGYTFTVVMYALINVLRIVEYAVLGTATWKFLILDKKLVELYLCILKQNKGKVARFTLGWFVLLCPNLLLGIAVPTFGILQELEYDDKMAPCYDHIGPVYIAYSAVNYLRYFCAFSVRIAFIITTAIIREIWEKQVTKLRSTLPNVAVENASKNKNFFSDWKTTANRLKHWVNGYDETGDKVKEILKIFQTWFIIPWVTFFIALSLDVNYTLQPWNDNSNTARTYYLLYSINQLITLFVPFLCATFINKYHCNFYKCMKKDLLHGYDSASQQAFACVQFNIEKEEEYDFTPRILFTDIEIRVDGPLYALFLLLGLFFAVCKPLLSPTGSILI